MITKTFTTFAMVLVIGNGLFAQNDNATPKVGDQIVITLTGDLAIEYALRTGALQKKQKGEGFQIETIATIAQSLDDGQIRIEHSSQSRPDGKEAILVTLTANVDPAKITIKQTQKVIPIRPRPGDSSGIPIEFAMPTKSFRLVLSNLKGLKLRTWVLSNEIGD